MVDFTRRHSPEVFDVWRVCHCCVNSASRIPNPKRQRVHQSRASKEADNQSRGRKPADPLM